MPVFSLPSFVMNKVQPILLMFIRSSGLAMCPSFFPTFHWKAAVKLPFPSVMKHKLESEIQHMGVLHTSLLFNSRYHTSSICHISGVVCLDIE